jgi:hypothetical protein
LIHIPSADIAGIGKELCRGLAAFRPFDQKSQAIAGEKRMGCGPRQAQMETSGGKIGLSRLGTIAVARR